MIKRLVRNGTSWSFVIDRPTMRALGLAPEGFVRYRVVDGQLVIRADDYAERKSVRGKREEDRSRNHDQRRELSMADVIRRLNAQCIGESEIRRLGYRGPGLLLFAHASAGRLDTKHNAILRALLERRARQPMFRGESWEDSIDAVVAEHGDLSDALGSIGAVSDTTR